MSKGRGAPWQRVRGIFTAYARRVYKTAEGTPVCDLVDGEGGIYPAARFVTPGGGLPNGWSYTPPGAEEDLENTAEVVCARTDGRLPKCFVLGALFPTSASSRVADKAAPGMVETEGFGFNYFGTQLVWRRDGTLIVDAQQSGADVEVNLSSGVMRVSQAGSATNDGLLLANATRLYMMAQKAVIDTLIGQVETLSTALGVPFVPPVLPDPPVGLESAAFAVSSRGKTDAG